MTCVRGGGPWSEQELDVVRDKFKLGWNDQQISEVLPGRSERAIEGKRCDMKLTRPLAIVPDAWSEQEREIVREKFMLGWRDQQISEVLPGRTEKAIQSKRREMKLTSKFFPDRPNLDRPQSGGRIYSAEEDRDILLRYNNGETAGDISQDYHVSARAMEAKIDRMLLNGGNKRSEPTARFCLWCGVRFFSVLHPKLNRRCPSCKSAAA